MDYKFKEGFYWSAAISALQCEGHHFEDGKCRTTWDEWYEKEPERFYDKIDNSIAVDFYSMYKEDIRLAKEIGLNSFRFSLAWSRVILEDGTVNQKAIEHYGKVIDECIKQGVEPFVCLFHFDMPLHMQNKGGWESREVLANFTRYAKVCFEAYGDRVTKWFTHNEPYVPIEACYFHGQQLVCCHRLADFLDPGEYRGDRDEFGVKSLRHQPRQRGLAHARRAPQDHRMRLAGFEGEAQRLAGAEQVLLPHHVVQRARPHTFGQRRRRVRLQRIARRHV